MGRCEFVEETGIVAPHEVLSFWLDEVGPDKWYGADDALDQEIRDRFGKSWAKARKGGLGLWLTYASGALAYLLLTDQFPRNMFRGTAEAFATDPQARAAAKSAITRGFDLRIDEPARQFFYLPLMHSENLIDQERCIRLIKERMPAFGAGTLLHARAHRNVIRQFGRFPFRNEALKRPFTVPEERFVANGGYGAELRALQAI